MGKKNKKSKKTSGWSDPPHDGGGFNNPFAALRPDASPPPAASQPKPKPATPKDSETPRRAVIRLERKGRGGKTVTLVTHLELNSDALERWSRELRKELGCGGGTDGDALLFQGDQRDRVADALRKRNIPQISKS